MGWDFSKDPELIPYVSPEDGWRKGLVCSNRLVNKIVEKFPGKNSRYMEFIVDLVFIVHNRNSFLYIHS